MSPTPHHTTPPPQPPHHNTSEIISIRAVLGMQPYFKTLDEIWKTTSIFSKMEDNLNFLKMEDDLILFEIGIQPNLFIKWKTTSNCLKMEDNLNLF